MAGRGTHVASTHRQLLANKRQVLLVCPAHILKRRTDGCSAGAASSQMAFASAGGAWLEAIKDSVSVAPWPLQQRHQSSVQGPACTIYSRCGCLAAYLRGGRWRRSLN